MRKFPLNNTGARDCCLRPEWTVGYLIESYPLTRHCFLRYTLELDTVWDLSIREYMESQFLDRSYGAIFRGFFASSLNNILAAFYQVPPSASWDLLAHTHAAAPAGFWPPRPRQLYLTEDGLGLARRGGLPGAYYWACNGAWSVRYSQASGALDQLCCWNWESGHRSSQALFPAEVIRFGVGDAPHAFEEVSLLPYGFDNKWGRNCANRSLLSLEQRSVFLELSGKGAAWVNFDFSARNQADSMRWNILGWDDLVGALVIHVGYMINRVCYSRFYPPFPEGMSQQDLLTIENASLANRELVPDRPIVGNLYLCVGGGDRAPVQLTENQWRFEASDCLRFQMTAGTTRQSAVANFERARSDHSCVQARCHAHYKSIQARCPVAEIPGLPNIEVIFATAPLLSETLKLGKDRLRHSASPSGYVDTHTSLMSMRALLYCGDYELVEGFLRFLADPQRRTPRGGIGTNFFLDGGMDDSFPDWTFNDVSWLALIGHLSWHSGEETPADLYSAGREHIVRILAESDAETGLIRTRGYWPDHPMKDVGRSGHPWTVNEAGIWYEALRNWEILSVRRGDVEFAEQLHATANRVRASFIPLFFDPEVELLCDSVNPETRQQHRQFSLFGLHFMYGMFGHELIDTTMAQRLAQAAFSGFYDASWKLFRTCLASGHFHSPFEFIYIHWLQGLTRLFRMGGHTEGLRALSDSFEYHYGKYASYPENFNMRPELSEAEHGAGGWFCETLSTRIQSIFEGILGLDLSPDSLNLMPAGKIDLPGAVLSHFRVGRCEYRIEWLESGAFPVLHLNGAVYPASLVVPLERPNQGVQQLEVRSMNTLPSWPVLTALVGLRLVDVELVNDRKLLVQIQGPGRAYVRFWSPVEPDIHLEGQALRVEWDEASHIAQVEITLRSDSINTLSVR
ncbi:hypothetical protein SH580_03470 [Coraliomargarita algicola]|uniref:Uncharacterized protein n=1 Tax=Coraliomargarita algicola TaxID=3092156 RepID=A0ABZ0RKM7_9BACT|nr:hypothetical protein [Coraliomargarita sp. J2-16]WPJ96764.1 hypothetical protein SH580_03470 [Coraliomargarita sp. J2-16]